MPLKALSFFRLFVRTSETSNFIVCLLSTSTPPVCFEWKGWLRALRVNLLVKALKIVFLFKLRTLDVLWPPRAKALRWHVCWRVCIKHGFRMSHDISILARRVSPNKYPGGAKRRNRTANKKQWLKSIHKHQQFIVFSWALNRRSRSLPCYGFRVLPRKVFPFQISFEFHFTI